MDGKPQGGEAGPESLSGGVGALVNGRAAVAADMNQPVRPRRDPVEQADQQQRHQADEEVAPPEGRRAAVTVAGSVSGGCAPARLNLGPPPRN